MGLEFKPWTWLYLGAALCVAGCVYIVLRVTSTGDTSLERVVWVLFGLTLALIAGGYYLEREERKKSDGSWLLDLDEILKEDDK